MIITNNYRLPEYLYNMLADSNYPPQRDRFSVTTLIGSPLIRWLTMKYWEQMTEDASARLWQFKGKMGHKVLDSLSSGHREVKLAISVDGITIVGRYDRLDSDLIDFKFTSVWAYIYGKEEWEQQMNLYSWAMWKVENKRPEGLRIDAFLDHWSKWDALKGGDYPPIPFASIPIRHWTFKVQDKYIQERLALHLAAQNMETPPAECTMKERWEEAASFAVMKSLAKRASRVFDTKEKATEYLGRRGTDIKSGYIQERPAKRRKCEDYCTVANYCPYWQAILKQQPKTEEEKND